MADRWASLPIVCKGGLDLSVDKLTLGTNEPGAATILQNYEPSIAGGYARIQGYSKWDSTVVPGTTNAPVLGVGAALGGVFGVRHSTVTTSNDIYFSSGSGWTKINTSTRGGTSIKARILPYVMATTAIIITDGIYYAAKWDGTTYTLINGTGAPSNPKFAAYFNESIALAGYGNGNKLSLSAPVTDTDFNGADGAIEFNFGDIITGIRTFRETLYVFCTNSIYEIVLTGTTPAYQINTITTGLGCLGQDTIQEVGGDLIYLAPDGFRSLAATYRIGDLQLGLLSKNIQPLLLANDFTTGRSVDSYSGVHIAQKNQFRCWVYDSSVPKVSTFGVVGKRIDDPINVKYEWGTLLGIQPYCAHSQYINNQEVVVIGDPTNGFVYRLENGNDFDGAAVSYMYRSPDLTFSDSTLRKVVQKLTVYTQIQGALNVILNVQPDTQIQNSLQPPSLTLTTMSAGALYGTAVYDTAIYGGISLPVLKLAIVGSGFLIAFQFSGTDNNPPHRIDSYTIEFGEHGRR